MKRTDLFQSKGYFRTAGVVLGLLLFMACSKDPMEDVTTLGQGTIRFEVTESDKPWQTRSSDVDETPEDQVIKMQGATPADTLFLHATVTRGIEPVSRQDTTADSQSPQTRATLITSADGITSFGLLATLYPNTPNSWGGGTNSYTPSYIYNAEVSRSNSWTLSSYRWPVGQRLRMFAYLPYNGQNVVLSDVTKTGNPTLTYKVPRILENQSDLMVAVSDVEVTESTTSVDMAFAHMLTAVKINADANLPAGSISKVSFEGLYNGATMDMWLGGSRWRDWIYGDNWVYEKIFDTPVQVGSGSKVEVLGGASTMMLLPQTLPEGAKLKVVYTDSVTNQEQTLTANLTGTWTEGTTVTYNISLSSISSSTTFTVAESTTDSTSLSVPYDGKTLTFNVKSTMDQTIGSVSSTINVPWTVKAVEVNNSNQEISWVTFSQNSGVGGTQSITMTVNPQKGEFNPGTASRTLQDAAELTGTTDLSMIGGARTTANCYLVHQAGRYLFPLIYGNAKKNGNDNESAYKFQGTSDGTHYLMTMKNYLDKDIQYPQIWRDCSNISKAVVLWSDAPNVVVNPTVTTQSSGEMDIVFDVPKETIRQANAVIALLDTSNRIMWSWHIWITPYGLDSSDIDVTTSDNHTFHMMSTNLGWRDDESGSFAAREFKVIFTQSSSTGAAVTKEFKVTQNKEDYHVPFSTPYYQWGRKDPLHPASSDANATPVYTYNNYQFTTESTATYVSNTITHPMTMFLGYSNKGSWSTTPRYNLWDSANGVATFDGYKKVVKTIYDPCPRGYCVPPVSAFKFTKYLSGSEDVINYYSKPSGTGEWVFYTSTKNQTSSKTIRVPLMGYRDPASNGALYQFKEYCTYWTAHSSDSETYGWAADFDAEGNPAYFQPATQASKNWACTIRPIREEE